MQIPPPSFTKSGKFAFFLLLGDPSLRAGLSAECLEVVSTLDRDMRSVCPRRAEISSPGQVEGLERVITLQ